MCYSYSLSEQDCPKMSFKGWILFSSRKSGGWAPWVAYSHNDWNNSSIKIDIF